MGFRRLKKAIFYGTLFAMGQSIAFGANAKTKEMTGSDIDLWIGDINVLSYDYESKDTASEIIFDSNYDTELIKVYQDDEHSYEIYAGDYDNNNTFDTVYLMPVMENVEIPGIRAYGKGHVLLETKSEVAGVQNAGGSFAILGMYEGDLDNNAPGYSFYGDDAVDFRINNTTVDDIKLQVEGTVRCEAFRAEGKGSISFGTKDKPVSTAFEISGSRDEARDFFTNDTAIALTDTDVKLYVRDAAVKSVVEQTDAPSFSVVCDGAELSINDLDGTSQMLQTDSDAALVVINGGRIVLGSSDAIEIPKLQAAYYSCKNEIREVQDKGSLLETPLVVDCEAGDNSDINGRYIYYFSEDKKSLSLSSTAKKLYPVEVSFLSFGSFDVKSGTGIKAIDKYYLEEGTEFTFCLLPDSGYNYKRESFVLCENNEIKTGAVKKEEATGCYSYDMGENPISISCEFEDVADDVKIDTEDIKGFSVDLGDNSSYGSKIYKIKEADSLATIQKNAIIEAAGDLYVAKRFELDLSTVVDAVNGDGGWLDEMYLLDSEMTVTFNLGDSLAGNKDYSIVELHGKTARKIASVYDDKTNSITFKTRRFAVFAVAYNRIDLEKCDIKLSTIKYTYSGKARKPAVTVTYDGEEVSDTHYSVYYRDNINAGTATVIVKGNSTSNHFAGRVEVKYTISQATNKLTLVTYYKKTVSGRAQSFGLSASAKAGTLSYTSNSKYVKVSNEGAVTISKGFIGSAVITVKASDSNYNTLSRKVTINVLPAKVSLKKLYNKKPSVLSVTWKKNSYATGYEIQYSRTKTFISGKTKTVVANGKDTLNTAISNLKKGGKYYVRIRAFKTSGGKKYYSAFSGIKYRIITR